MTNVYYDKNDYRVLPRPSLRVLPAGKPPSRVDPWSSRRSTRSAHHGEAAIGEEGEAVVEVRLGQVVHHGHMRAAWMVKGSEMGDFGGG